MKGLGNIFYRGEKLPNLKYEVGRGKYEVISDNA